MATRLMGFLALSAVVASSCSAGSGAVGDAAEASGTPRSSFALEGTVETGFTLYLDGIETSQSGSGVIVQLHPLSRDIVLATREAEPTDAEFLVCPTGTESGAQLAQPSADCTRVRSGSAAAIELPTADGRTHVAFSITSQSIAAIRRAEVSYQPADSYVAVDFIRR